MSQFIVTAIGVTFAISYVYYFYKEDLETYKLEIEHERKLEEIENSSNDSKKWEIEWSKEKNEKKKKSEMINY
jgi:hypothetical protein